MLYPLPSDKYKTKGLLIGEAPLERYKKCCDSDVSSMQRVAGITHSEVHWIFHHLAQSLDSPLYLANFQIVTVCVGACVRTYVRA